MWTTAIKKSRNPPENFYLHHPLVRNGEIQSIETDPNSLDEDALLNHAMGLSLADRVRKEWKNINRKKAFFQLRYLRHKLQTERRKNEFLVESVEQIAPQNLSAIELNMAQIELANPSPSETGSEMLFENEEEEVDTKIGQITQKAISDKMDRVSGESGLLEKGDKNVKNIDKMSLLEAGKGIVNK
ncbi:hypothetical protein MHBO_003126 [Bonamia ostreae]|uniref:Uncharacterized protein n=1 Tax=Bonamia ostreae TaxID=126728 RepID=A0ABV2API7_9EUKA